MARVTEGAGSWRNYALAAAAAARGGPVLASLTFAVALGAPEEYFVIALLTVYTPVVTLVASLGLDYGLFRTWAAAPRQSAALRGDALFALLAALLFAPVSIVLGALVAAWFGTDILSFIVAGIAGVVQAGTLLVVTAYQRALLQGRRYLLTAGAIALTSLVARVLLLQADMPVTWAWVAGDVLTALVGLGVFVWWVQRDCLPGRGHSRRGLLRFGLPLTWHGLWQWGLGSSDRFVLGSFVPTAQLGLYGAVYQIGGAYNAVASEMSKSGLHRYAATDSSRVMAAMKADSRLLGVCWLVCGVPAVLAMLLLSRLGYEGALPLGVALYVSLLPLVGYLPLAAETGVYAGRSEALNYSSLSGFAANVFTNLTLVHLIGVYAGAVANALGFSMMWLTLWLLRRRRRDLDEILSAPRDHVRQPGAS